MSSGPPHTLHRLPRPSYSHLTMTVAVLLVAVPAVALFPGTVHLADGLRGDVTGWSLLAFAAVAVVAAALKGLSASAARCWSHRSRR